MYLRPLLRDNYCKGLLHIPTYCIHMFKYILNESIVRLTFFNFRIKFKILDMASKMLNRQLLGFLFPSVTAPSHIILSSVPRTFPFTSAVSLSGTFQFPQD